MSNAIDDQLVRDGSVAPNAADAVAEEETLDDELVQARAAARRSEEELGNALARLEQSILEPFDLRAQIKDSPLHWLAGAFLVGLMIGRIRNSSHDGDR